MKKNHLPNEILAMTAERWLFEKSWHKIMIFHNVNVFFLQSTLTSTNFFRERGTRIPRSKGILARVIFLILIVRHFVVFNCFPKWWFENRVRFEGDVYNSSILVNTRAINAFPVLFDFCLAHTYTSHTRTRDHAHFHQIQWVDRLKNSDAFYRDNLYRWMNTNVENNDWNRWSK